MTPFNQRVAAVCRREYLQRVKNKWFIVTTLMIPALLLGIWGLMAWVEGRPPTTEKALRVGIVDHSGAGLDRRLTGVFTREYEPLIPGRRGTGIGVGAGGRAGDSAAELPAPLADAAKRIGARAPVEMQPADVPAGAGQEELAGSLRASGFDAYLYLPEGVLEAPDHTLPASVREAQGARILALEGVNDAHRRVIRSATRRAVVAARLQRAGVNEAEAEVLLRASRLQTEIVRVDQQEADSQVAMEAAGGILGGILYFMLLIYGQMIVRGVMEEKSSDIVEVLLSSLRPWEMMLGKIVGVGAVGLTQVGIWALLIGGIVTYATLASAPMLAETLAQSGVDLGELALTLLPVFGLFLLFFLLGYLLYSSLFAAAGALAGSETDAQQVTLPLTLPIVAGFFLMIFTYDAPDAVWTLVGAQIPLFSPMVMVARYAGGYAGTAEVVLSLVLLALGVVAAVWLAGRVYRVGILMKGKRPNLPELVRWVRYG